MITTILVAGFGTLGAVWAWLGRAVATVDRARGGLALDVGLYATSALFALLTATGSTLAPHRAWGTFAAAGYGVAAFVALAQLVARSALPDPSGSAAPPPWTRTWGPRARAAVALGAWGATALVPLVALAVQRSQGRTDRAQEEVIVIEDGGRRLLEAGTPYLGRSVIAALPEGDRLVAYLPYQPGMAAFGIPRALDDGAGWWSDARVWFALGTAAALAAAVLVLRRAGARPFALVRGLQVATVLPVCALTLATGGDDMPVLALCLLALALTASGRLGWAGLAVGGAAALKLFAWPIALVLAAHAFTRGRPAMLRYLAGAVEPPMIAILPAAAADPAALIENMVSFPMGHGLVSSPAQSPLPGHLIAASVPGGTTIATLLLLAAAVAIAGWLIRRPPRTAADASLICGYGLLAATLLLPSTRFGYLLYPAAFLVWAAALRGARAPQSRRPTTSKTAAAAGA